MLSINEAPPTSAQADCRAPPRLEIRLLRTSAPPPILSNVPGTWAYDTMSRRVRDEILSRIYSENGVDRPEMVGIKAQLDQLNADMLKPAESRLRPIGDDGGPDISTWRELLRPYQEAGTDNWLDTPWLVAEFYFYRKIAEIFQYFKTGTDPFALQKRLGLEASLQMTKELAAREAAAGEIVDAVTALRLSVFASLWGNKMDLSLWPTQTGAANKAEAFASVLEASAGNLLADHFNALADHLVANKGGRVDIVVDNAGFELVTDLFLGDCLIQEGLASKVVFHTKGHPTFVSDAMDKDVKETISYLRDQGVGCAERWGEYLKDGRWELHSHLYWAQPYPFWIMPEDVVADVRRSTLCFIKGDANYRRLLGDRQWDLTIPFEEVAGYFPCAVAPLRTLKAELGCGMEGDKVAMARERDPQNWMVSGKYGVVQFFRPA